MSLKTLFLSTIVLYTRLILAQDQDIDLANEYYLANEYNKALDLYQKLSRDVANIPQIHDNYLDLLIEEQKFRRAEKYVEDAIEAFPENMSYKVDKGILYYRNGDSTEAAAYYQQLFEDVSLNKYQTRITASYLSRSQLLEDAIKLFQQSRQHFDDPVLYALDMASIYRVMNNYDQMTEEYLNFARINPANVNYVQNVLGRLLIEKEDLEAFQKKLINRIQQSPGNNSYTELLIWAYLQESDFYSAFVQARALDKRQKSKGNRVMEVGKMAMNNKDYPNAIRIFEYIAESYPTSINYIYARRYLINTREEMVKNTFPINQEELLKLISSYDELIREVGYTRNSIAVLKDKAQLYAFYLNKLDTAINLLNEVIKSPFAHMDLVSESKMMLGDIYILKQEPWESTLIYAQVEKANKDSPIAYEAKYKIARLYYFRSEFQLAKDNLDILKEATSREIANDALDLSLLIQNNSYEEDSLNDALKTFASIDLMLFQNQNNKALQAYDKFLNDFKNHSLCDEVFMRQADIYTKKGEYDMALQKYNDVIESYSWDILADDAQFKKAELYEYQLKNKEKAMEAYEKILTDYTGSIFTAKARKSFRKLRGDLENQDL